MNRIVDVRSVANRYIEVLVDLGDYEIVGRIPRAFVVSELRGADDSDSVRKYLEEHMDSVSGALVAKARASEPPEIAEHLPYRQHSQSPFDAFEIVSVRKK